MSGGYYQNPPVCRIGKRCGNACIPMANNCRKTNPLGEPNRRTVKPNCKPHNISCGYSCIPAYRTCHKNNIENESSQMEVDENYPPEPYPDAPHSSEETYADIPSSGGFPSPPPVPEHQHSMNLEEELQMNNYSYIVK